MPPYGGTLAGEPMRVETTLLPGLLVIEPGVFADERGLFFESFQRQRYAEAGIKEEFVQDNLSRSANGVLRGLHFQVRRPQAQIVTVVRGRIFDVAVDLRRGSVTFGKWYGRELSDEGPRQLYMPAGFAHGFCVLSEITDLHYKVTQFYESGDEGGVLWNDPDLAIDWPLRDPRLSARDAAYPRLRELTEAQLPR